MEIEAYGQLWNQALVRLLSVRAGQVERNCLQARLRLPSHTFIMVTRGTGSILTSDGAVHAVDGFYVLHGRKADTLHFKPDTSFDYYYIDYMSMPSHPEPYSLERTGGETAAFGMRYGFKPSSPLLLCELVEQMHADWNNLGPLQNLAVASQFYKWLYEALKQFRQMDNTEGPNRVARAVQYMKSHYAEPLMLEQIASAAGCGVRYLNSLFRDRFQISPLQLLIGIRMERAMELLTGTVAPLHEIAERTGYASGYSLSRHFKKYYGSSPRHFRDAGRGSAAKGAYGEAVEAANRLESEAAAKEARAEDVRSGNRVRMSASSRNGSRNRVVRSPMGDVSVPARPDRVVVDWQLGSVLALGVTPVGCPRSLVQNNKLLHRHMGNECEDIGNHNHIDMEKVVELEPDLIITSSRSLYASYSRIAPTVFYNGSDYSTVSDQIHAMGVILNRAEHARKWMHYYAQRSSEIRGLAQKRIPPGKTFSIMDPNWGEEMIVVGNTEHRGGRTLFGLLEQRPNERLFRELKESAKDAVVVSWEKAEQYKSDYTLMMISQAGSDKARGMNWNRWIGAEGSQVLMLEWEKYFLSDPLSTLLQGEELLESFR